ncbi:MAG: hypothetical protein ACLQFR_21245 [Streptosporangiaceae bacterium]
MRKLLLPAAAAAAALLAVLPMTAASAATHDVLTTGKPNGTNVKVGAILKASLKAKTTATFLTSGKNGVTCKKVMFTDKVIKNPSSPGTAHENLTAQTFSSCTVKGIPGATGVKSVKLNKLPYPTTIQSKGGVVTVSGTNTTITLNTSVGTISCTYKASTTKGTASNKAQTISFSKQKFTRTASPLACPPNGTFSATFGPVLDTSVKGNPHVFVN